MSDEKNPEAGQRCKVATGGGEEVAVWTGFMWASEDGSRLIDEADIKSWEAAPAEGELKVTFPEGVKMETPPEGEPESE